MNVFFYLKKVGRQCKEETTENQSENGKQDALGQICGVIMYNVQFNQQSQAEPRLKLTEQNCGYTQALKQALDQPPPQTLSGSSDTAFGAPSNSKMT